MPLKDIYDKLKTTVVGTKTSTIDAKLDNAVKDIVSFRTNIGRNGYIDLIKNLIAKSGSGDLSQNMFQQGTTPAALGQGGRLLRYKTYEAIVSNINYCYRALNVIIDNVLSPDDITKVSLDIKPKNFLEDENEANPQVKQIREIITQIKLEERLDTIVKGALEFGDFFCEIADSKTALTSKAYLTEYVTNYNSTNRGLETIQLESEDHQNLKIVMDYSPLVEDTKNKDKPKDFEKIDLHLLFYEPKRVVKLQSDLYPVCFGYLVFPLVTVAPQLMLQNQLVNNACAQILKSLQKRIPEMPSDQINQKDLKDIINTMIRETDFARAMNIRYVPPDKMQHFQVPSTKYYPYGESIFDSCQFIAKVLVALETALTIHRLNRSTEKRKIAIEIGLSRDARKAIESLKEEFRKRKVNLDSFGTVDTIPSMINTFEDVYIPQKDGKPFVDISTFNEGGTDIRGKTDELKFLRDQLVASLGVPASFLNIEENLSNKCLVLSTKLPLVSGKKSTLLELINEFNENGEIKDKYTFSYDDETGNIVPGKIVWAGITRKNTQVVKITLDNGEYEIVTPDHHFMLRDGSYIEAQDLKPGDSLMPLYTRITNNKTTLHKTPYLEIYHPGKETWEPAHRAFAKTMKIVKDGDMLNVHHKDFNPMNNNPSNFEALTNKDHLNEHIKHKHFITTGRGNVKIENYVKDNCIICGKEYIKHIQTNQITCLSKECKRERKRLDGIKSFEKRKDKCSNLVDLKCPYCGIIFNRRHSYIVKIKSGIITCGKTECYKKSFIDYSNTPERSKLLSEFGKKGGYNSKEKLVEYNRINGAPMKGITKESSPELFERRLKTLKENRNLSLNHKVVSVEFLNERVDTGDITIEKYHNFAVSSGIIVSNSALSEENILFARTIIRHQKYLGHQVKELVQKVYKLVDPDKYFEVLDNVLIGFAPPKSLQFEREAKYMGDLANLVETLERIGIPREWSKKRYLSNIDWNEVKKYEIDTKIDQSIGTQSDTATGDMGAGALGGMGMGMSGGLPGMGGGGMEPGGGNTGGF